MNYRTAALPEPSTSARAEMPVGVWQWDFAAQRFSVDPVWCSSLGIDPCEGPDHLERWMRRVHPDDTAEFQQEHAAVRLGRLERFEIEYRVRVGEARWLWVLQRGRIIERDSEGHALHVEGICIEIDERKRVEVTLQENEARLGTALWGARAAFWQLNVASDVVAMSPLWFAMTGYTREQWESIPNPWLSRIHPDDLPAVQLQIQKHLGGQSTSIDAEYRIRTASDEWKWMLTRGRAVEWDFEGKVTSAIGVSLDIDPQKRAERELRSSEARLETAVWGAGMGLWELDFRSDTTRWYSDWCDRLELQSCEGRDHVARWDASIHPDDVAVAATRFNAHVAGRADYYDAEYRIRDKKGRWRWLFERGRVIDRDGMGRALRMVGVCMDIEERKEAELEYIRSQRRLEAALESARGGMWDWDVASGEVSHAEPYYRILGVDPGTCDRTWSFWNARVHPEERARVEAAVNDVLKGRKDLYESEYRLQHQDGSWRWVLDRGRVPERDANGRATRMVGFLVEVTDRVEAQEQLRQSEFRYRTVASMAPGYVFEYRYNADQQPEPVFASDGMQALFGGALEQRSGMWESLVDEEWRSIVAARHKRLLQGEPQKGESRIHTLAGEQKWLYVSELPMRDPQTGLVTGVLGAAYDITARKDAEDALKTQARILATMREGVVLIDAATHQIALTNVTFDQMFGYGEGELKGQTIDPLFSMPALQRKRVERTLRDASDASEGMPVEFECSRKDGSRFVATCASTPLRTNNRDHWLAVLNDVTERKRLEREIIEISNREQQRIGSDLHDGLGQDLTGIALMLRGVAAQLRKEGSAARTDVEEVIGLVNNAIESTRSLARGLSPVGGERGGLAAAVETLTARASERYGVRVELITNLEEPLRLNETSATHVYRIVQEALTNVIRHSKATDVTISLETMGEELHLRVDDNGRGFEQPAPDSPGGLGLKIMRYRAQMLGGDLILESGMTGGASVRCSCPLDAVMTRS